MTFYYNIILCSRFSDILDLGPPRSSLGTIIRIDLWTYDVIHVCNLGNNKQLLDEVEHDIMNYQNRGLCYRLRQIIQTRGFDNS